MKEYEDVEAIEKSILLVKESQQVIMNGRMM